MEERRVMTIYGPMLATAKTCAGKTSDLYVPVESWSEVTCNMTIVPELTALRKRRHSQEQLANLLRCIS